MFSGTRVPVRTVAAWIEHGIPDRQILESYPSLNEEMLGASTVWAKTNPRRGRPPRFAELNPTWDLKQGVRIKLNEQGDFNLL
ncbi:MAG: DUF433 domain-containing protein [Proteobacteria bacterium]|nr:DUF433 domain-containing protein [Pseudomonadota bacterium]MDE3208928.1 DUF433 domain-containing protein [Pseudomonadota bacterium]